MKIESFSGELHPGITMHKIPVGAGFPGLVFTIGMLAVFLMGIPALIYFLVLAIVLGIGFAVMLRFIPHEAGLVALIFTAVVLVCLVGIPGVEDWSQEEKNDLKDAFASLIFPPAPPPARYELSAYQCDCHERKSKQPCDRTTWRERGQKRPGPPSPFDGMWDGTMNDLPGIRLIVADGGGGEIGGVVTFYFQKRDDGGPWRVADKFVAPLLAAHAEGKILVFEVQRHKTHGSLEFGPNVKFRAELAGGNEAVLYNLSEPSMGPSRLMRQE